MTTLLTSPRHSSDIEAWLPIPGSDCYEASTHGRIRSVDHYVKNRSGRPTTLIRGRILSTPPESSGYAVCGIRLNGVKKTVKVARVVATTFLGDIPEGWHVDHIDGVLTNNRLSNLDIISARENYERRGGSNRQERYRLTPAQKEEALEARKNGVTWLELAAKYGYSGSGMQKALYRHTQKKVAAA